MAEIASMQRGLAHSSSFSSPQQVQHPCGGHHGARCALHHPQLLLQGPAERPDGGPSQDPGAGGISR